MAGEWFRALGATTRAEKRDVPGLGGMWVGATWLIASTFLLCGYGCVPAGSNGNDNGNDNTSANRAVVFGYNELGMHCMNQDFSELMLLPPYNNLRAQVIERAAEEPRILSSGVTITYSLPLNTHSSNKTNFWDHAEALLGVTLAPDVGLAGLGLSGTMSPTGENDWVATGIPVTPLSDDGTLDPYPLSNITVTSAGSTIATSDTAVVPVSWEIRCDLCHTAADVTTATDILQDHDRLHGTELEANKPVLCASCHADPALSLEGVPGIPALSHAMHTSHAPRMAVLSLEVECYACHPGEETMCLRDVHLDDGMTCTDCHESMEAVGSTDRQPWMDEPRCGNCHSRSGYSFEQTGTLYRMSKGHGGVHCAACHGSPHAITPTVTSRDNLQAVALQGHEGPIDTCSVCHTRTPGESFFHSLSEE